MPKQIAINGYITADGPTQRFAFPVSVEKRGSSNYRVVYGQQVYGHLDYNEACKRLGQAIMHALNCDGVFD